MMKLAVLFGGRSAEHEISIITALQLIEAVDRIKYDIIPVYIDQEGFWYTGELLLDKSIYINFANYKDRLQRVALLPCPGQCGLKVLDKADRFIKDIEIDLYFLAFHGQYGEDGCVQGLMEMADVPYTGCDVLSSAVAMNKGICKAVVKNLKIPVLHDIIVHKMDMMSDPETVVNAIIDEDEFGGKYFVKPVNLGSSIGVGKATDKDSLYTALARSFKYDTEVIVERCLDNMMEVNISVLSDGDEVHISVVELPIASDGVLTYEDKYMRGSKSKSGEMSGGMASLTRKIDPDELDRSIKDRIGVYAAKIYKSLGCGGVVRFDFCIDLDSDEIYFNELNVVPGSLAFYLWEHKYLYTELLESVIKDAFKSFSMKLSVKRDLNFKALS